MAPRRSGPWLLWAMPAQRRLPTLADIPLPHLGGGFIDPERPAMHTLPTPAPDSHRLNAAGAGPATARVL